ncbi:histone-like nucleoid-structuring protein Lsr2 [Streptomyces sp. NPDC048603]|uniref:Lsr2 family DNA-binding protein n=1 Tax=Streptomyces sp. NPDC048603 TaxID=3365577 RepID=UPI00372418CC
MTDISALTRLCPPPEKPMTIDWTSVESALGMALPADYRQLADRYGPGRFNDYLSLFHPHGVTEFVNLTGLMPGRIRAQLHEQARLGTPPLPHHPDSLFPIGVTDNGEYLFWVTDSLDAPEQWRIAVNEARGPHWYTFDGGLTNFLVSVLSGMTRVPVFPSGLAEQEPSFAPSRPVLYKTSYTPLQPPVDTAAIRTWARANGYDVPSRGRIPPEVRRAWEDAHQT